MSEEKMQLATIYYWWDKAKASLLAAQRELEAGDLARLYPNDVKGVEKKEKVV